MKSCNLKYPETKDVIVFSFGQNKETLKNVIKNIPKDNPVVISDPKQCKIGEYQKAAFIVIITDDYNYVIYLFSYFSEFDYF